MERSAQAAGLGDALAVETDCACDFRVVHVVDIGAVIGQAVDQHFELHHAQSRVVEDNNLDGQVVHARGYQLAKEHRKAAIAGNGDNLTVWEGHLCTDCVRKRIGHRTVQERADETTGAKRIDVACGPHIAHTRVSREDRVL